MNNVNIPTGIIVRGNSVYIDFRFKGRRFKEKIDSITKITQSNINHCERKRNAILVEIAEGRFDFRKHFPNSKSIELDSSVNRNLTVWEAVDNWMNIQETKKARSTYRNYSNKARKIKVYFNEQKRICEVTKSQIESFQVHLLKSGLSAKVVNDAFTVVRGVWGDAFDDEIIDTNPLHKIRNLDTVDPTPDPFEKSELEIFENSRPKYPQEINQILFTCWTGLSISEVFGLAWEDVDFTNWQIHIRRSIVEDRIKVPKEKSRERVVELIEPAIKYLIAQRQHTEMLPPEKIEIFQRNNYTTLDDQVRFVFVNPDTQLRWSMTPFRERFGKLIRKLRIRTRGPNQCRHTFASQLLSNYIPQEWIAKQMGHKDTTMLKKHYAKWIKNDMPSMASWVSQQLGFETSLRDEPDFSGPGISKMVPKWSQENKKPNEINKIIGRSERI